MKKKTMLSGAVGFAMAVTLLSAPPASAEDAAAAHDGAVLGGWSEEQGSTTHSEGSAVGVLATVNHRGKAETKVIGGTTHKRSHGWTTWSGVRHYTTARLEHTWPASGVIATSGRKWGTNGTEAVTGWKRYDPNATSNGFGSARTYYGR